MPTAADACHRNRENRRNIITAITVVREAPATLRLTTAGRARRTTGQGRGTIPHGITPRTATTGQRAGLQVPATPRHLPDRQEAPEQIAADQLAAEEAETND